MADTASRILDIALIPGNDMDVQMRNRLPRRFAGIDSDVVTRGRSVLFNHTLDLANRGDKLLLFLFGRLEPGPDVALWNEQRVTVRNRTRSVRRSTGQR